LKTLTDGFRAAYPDINTYTGQWMTGGSQTAKSHVRLNRAHAETIFRVRVEVSSRARRKQ
jgi:hypothetical protein